MAAASSAGPNISEANEKASMNTMSSSINANKRKSKKEKEEEEKDDGLPYNPLVPEPW